MYKRYIQEYPLHRKQSESKYDGKEVNLIYNPNENNHKYLINNKGLNKTVPLLTRVAGQDALSISTKTESQSTIQSYSTTSTSNCNIIKRNSMHYCSICTKSKKIHSTNEDTNGIKWWKYVEKLEDIQFPKNNEPYLQTSIINSQEKLTTTTSNIPEFKSDHKRTETMDLNKTSNHHDEVRKVTVTFQDIKDEIISSTRTHVTNIMTLIIFDMLAAYFLGQEFVNNLTEQLPLYMFNISENFKYLFKCTLQLYKRFFKQVFIRIYTTTIQSTGVPKNFEESLVSIADELHDIKEILLIYKNNVSNSIAEPFSLKLPVPQLHEKIVHASPPPPPPPLMPPPLLQPLTSCEIQGVNKASYKKTRLADPPAFRPIITVDDLKSVRLRKIPKLPN